MLLFPFPQPPEASFSKLIEVGLAICYALGMEEMLEYKRYKIGQAAKEIGVKTHTLRFWEDEFDEIVPIRTDTGQRLYTEENLVLLREIKHLLYDEGLTIDGAKKRMNAQDHSGILREVRDELLQIKEIIRK